MRIPSGVTDQVINFVAVDSTDLETRETGLTSFTVYRDRNGGGATAMTTPTVTEVDATNMPGVYKLLCDEDMTVGAGNDSEEMVYHITQASMAPVTRTIEIYRRTVTAGYTLGVASDGDISGNVDGAVASVTADVTTDAASRTASKADVSALATAAALATAQADLDKITGLDGATLATAQALYAPSKAGDNMGLTAGGATTATNDMDANSTRLAAIETDTGTTIPAQISALITTQMTESYAADGVAPTPAQALMLIQQRLTEMAVVGTTMTIKKLDRSTTAATLTHDDAANPTSATRAT